AVTTVPETRKVWCDSAGIATLDQISAGTYEVKVSNENYPDFTRSIQVNADAPEPISFTYISTLVLTVKDDRGETLSGASISSVPVTDERVADENGRAVFSNMPQTSLKFVIRRDRYPNAIVPVDLKNRELLITVESAAPRVDIFSPKLDDSFTSPYDIRLNGRGTDIEDGILPDASLVWISDIDGELGTGQTLVAPFLSNGYHVITLRGADSDGKVTETSVAFMVFDYQLDSYFPIPAGETWAYRYLVPEFYLTNTDNVSEYWVLKGLNVKIDKQLRRTVDIYWDTTAQMITTHFRLTLVDSLILDNGNLYIGQTVEQSREWTGAVEKPYFIMHIATSYRPWYTFLKNVTDIAREPSYDSSVRIETMYTYSYYNSHSTVFHESSVLNTSLQIGNEEIIQTDKGLLKARSLSIKQGNSEKKWYLTKGLGLIRIEDKALNISTVALMTSASLYRFHSPLGKEAGVVAPMLASGGVPRFDLRINREKPEDLRRLHRFLAGLAPRL
ncbi:MAG: hypothetical protein ACYC9O_03520, partial [Candidatus Latescibacterota bacterium]